MTAAAADRLVNMVPNTRSGETNQDSEPTITIDPHDSSRMAGSAFTWDNLTGAPMTSDVAPIYVTIDGGNTWALSYIVPSKQGARVPTGDITLSFSSSLAGGAHQGSWLYAGILLATPWHWPGWIESPSMEVLRTRDPFAGTLMTVLETRPPNVDQPHTISKTGPGGDKLYVGYNDGWGCTVANGRTSTLDVSQDATVITPTFVQNVIETRDTTCEDGFAQVPAASSDGTVYAAFIHDYYMGTPRLVVVRDNNWGAGGFADLKDSDGRAGRYVTAVLTLWPIIEWMGQQRLGGSNVSIAVDPNNSNHVYVAWGDKSGPNIERIHVRRSIDRGDNWSSNDLMTVDGATNPEIAINDLGIVGVLYQQFDSGRWKTRISLSNNMDATQFNVPGRLLANTDAATPVRIKEPYIGDYASLVANGTNFVGAFSASNYPDKSYFMKGVTYQREVDWDTHKLYADAAHTQEVTPSIDPFFFKIETTICDRDPDVCKNVCLVDPQLCAPLYDPWWWLNCPMCRIQILVDPGDEYKQVRVYNTLGNEVGVLKPLARRITEKGVTYSYSIDVRSEKGVGYVLKANVQTGQRLRHAFAPRYTVRLGEAPRIQ
jgi:hypothetical protein